MSLPCVLDMAHPSSAMGHEACSRGALWSTSPALGHVRCCGSGGTSYLYSRFSRIQVLITSADGDGDKMWITGALEMLVDRCAADHLTRIGRWPTGSARSSTRLASRAIGTPASQAATATPRSAA